MGRRCSICDSPHRGEIEFALAGGVTLAETARKFNVSKSQVHRHWHDHTTQTLKEKMAAQFAGAEISREVAQAREHENLIQNIVAQRGRLLAIQADCIERNDLAGARACEKHIGENLKLMSGVLGELHHKQQIRIENVLTSPSYLSLRASILKALGPYPEARNAVARAIAAQEGAPVHLTGIAAQHQPTPTPSPGRPARLPPRVIENDPDS